MIRHVVMMKLTDRRPEVAHEIVRRLEALPPLVPEIRSYQAGVNVIDGERAWDVVLVSDFDSAEELAAYQVHPDHVEVATFIRASTEQTATVDFEVA